MTVGPTGHYGLTLGKELLILLSILHKVIRNLLALDFTPLIVEPESLEHARVEFSGFLLECGFVFFEQAEGTAHGLLVIKVKRQGTRPPYKRVHPDCKGERRNDHG